MGQDSARRGEELIALVEVMDRLRSPGGCPWDAEQTHQSLVEYLIEESYEAVEAIELRDDAAIREELGDVLLQVVFHSRIAQEHERPWDIDDVARGITQKLIARHPHVFAGADAATAADVEANWAALKAAEKGRESVTDGIPAALPALLLASKLMSRSSSLGVSATSEEAVKAARKAIDEVGYGELLLAVVAAARDDGVDAETELREAVRGLRNRIRTSEGLES
jgi:XTP/dITP diphosphohydrolase